MKKLTKLKAGDKIAILSPSSAAPGKWPHVYQLGLKRIKHDFGLIPIEFPTTAKVNASSEERAHDLIAAFEDDSIKGIITSIGGDDQVTYIKNLPSEPFASNPKPLFGFSDNSHFANFLWINDIPSYYGGAVFTQFAMQSEMDAYTKQYLRYALFEEGEYELVPSEEYNDVSLSWEDETLLHTRRLYEKNDGWHWNEGVNATGILWGGCLESVDEMLRHDVQIPTLEQFENVVLMLETSEEMPTADYVFRVLRAFGERGILSRIQGLLLGRPQAWGFENPRNAEEKEEYRKEQRKKVLEAVQAYVKKDLPVIQNMDFGHTNPQIPMPYGGEVRIDSNAKKIFARF